MENSRLPFGTCILVMLFMTTTKKAISAFELERLLGHKRYIYIWSAMHRLRTVMGERGLYRLPDKIKFDEGYFENKYQNIPNQT